MHQSVIIEWAKSTEIEHFVQMDAQKLNVLQEPALCTISPAYRCLKIKKNDLPPVFAVFSNKRNLLANFLFLDRILAENKSILDAIKAFLFKQGYALIKIQSTLDIANNQQSTHATLYLKKGKSADELWNGLSQHHQRAIKKAKKNNLIFKELRYSEEINLIVAGLKALYIRRNLKFEAQKDPESLTKLLHLILNKLHFGKVLVITNEENEICGAAIFLIINGAYYYYAGFANTESKLPILHLAFWELMLLAQREDLDIDFGGYALSADKQLQAINSFKKGFGATIYYYPSEKIFYKNLLIKFIFNAFYLIKNVWNSRNTK